MQFQKRTLFIQFVLFLFLVLILGQTLQAATTDKHIILQGFNWESYNKNHYQEILSKADEIQQAGFNMVWFPPASLGYDGEDLYPHSRGYIPLSYTNFNSSYGSERDLINVVKELKRRGILAMADIVINHRGVSYYEPGHKGDNHYARFNDFDWGLWAFTSGHGQHGQGARDTGADYSFAFDIDITNGKVRSDIQQLLDLLKTKVGFSAWRYDYVKGYNGEFVGHLNYNSNPELSIGEYWDYMDYCDNNTLCFNQDKHRQKIINWIDQTWKGSGRSSAKASSAFDFTTKGILQEAIRNNEFWRLKDGQGKAPGLIGWWSEKAVTFIDNHDTGSTQGHWPFGNRNQVLQGYAYILTHPGTPTVFWDHFFNWNLKSEISELIKLRDEYGITKNSKLEILEAMQGLYVARIDNRIIVKLGNDNWSAGPEYFKSIKGHNYAIWLK